jgi:DNA-binding NarL/FixJ family response regulator
MKILLCGNRESTRKRWLKALQPECENISECDSFRDVTLALTLSGASQYTILAHANCIGISRAQELINRFPGCKLVIFSDNPDDIKNIEYLKVGVVGVANAYISMDLLQEVIRVVDSGGVWIGNDLMQRIVVASFQASDNDLIDATNLPGEGLTNRELQIAKFIAQGYANKEIANQLKITERTVKAHLNSIYRKTDTKGRLELALLFKR